MLKCFLGWYESILSHLFSSLHPVPQGCSKTTNPLSLLDPRFLLLSPLCSNYLQLFFLCFVYLLFFCLRHFSLVPVFTQYESGGPQELLSTQIDEDGVRLTPDLHWCNWQLKRFQFKSSSRKSGLTLQINIEQDGREALNFQKGHLPQAYLPLKENGPIHIEKLNALAQISECILRNSSVMYHDSLKTYSTDLHDKVKASASHLHVWGLILPKSAEVNRETPVEFCPAWPSESKRRRAWSAEAKDLWPLPVAPWTSVASVPLHPCRSQIPLSLWKPNLSGSLWV